MLVVVGASVLTCAYYYPDLRGALGYRVRTQGGTGFWRWVWTGVAVIAALNLLTNLPRYVWMAGNLGGGR